MARRAFANSLLLAGGCLAAQGSPAPALPDFTIATYNVLYLNRDLTNLAATIRQMRADFVALQETTPPAEKFLRRELATEYPHMSFRGGERASDGFGFLSKVPLKHLQFLDPLPGWRGTWMVEVSLGGTNLQIISVHLATPKPRNMNSLTGALTMFQKVEELHEREMARIYEHVSRQMPVIVLGDFNSFSFFYGPKFLTEHGFVDSFAALTPDADQHGTWCFRSGESQLCFRIDFIFHSADLRTRESRIIKSEASDHYPVVSKLGWAK